MLQLLRKYQSYIYIFITVIIVISFSFFGTYQSLPSHPLHDQIAFTAVDGSKVSRLDLDELVLFLGTDSADKRLFQGVWGPNFLNDGVIRNDFLESGLAKVLVLAYPEEVSKDLQSRLEKEKKFTLYKHPQAKFISIENTWSHFAPQMKTQFDQLRKASNATDETAFDARVALFLGEKQFPSHLLRQFLMYQESQNSWLIPDQALEHNDLSLYGYHTLDDWFGPRLMRLIGEFIINSSKVAEDHGYVVTREEALTDLRRNAEISFQENKKSPHVDVTNSAEYFNEQLRRLNMDQSKVIKIWQQVMLFRRLFQDLGNANVIDPMIYQQFYNYAKESLVGDAYTLPKPLQFKQYKDLQQFEVYLDAIAARSKEDKERSSLPQQFLSIDEIKKANPELIQKRFLLEMTTVNKNALQAKVTLKEMWNWEVQDNHWEHLKTQFKELEEATNTREGRFAALDRLDNNTRNRLDLMARKAIVDEHPNWLQEAFSQTNPEVVEVAVRAVGGNFFIPDLKNREEFIQRLEAAANDKLQVTSGDGESYYSIIVLEKMPYEEVATFAEAKQEGILESLLDKKLEAHYAKIKERRPDEYKQPDDSWKPFSSVKESVANDYFATVLKGIQTASGSPKKLNGDKSASARFLAYMKTQKDEIKQSQGDATGLLADKRSDSEKKLSVRNGLSDQWKLEKEPFKLKRSELAKTMNKESLFNLKQGEWSDVISSSEGSIAFYHLFEKDLILDGDLNASIEKGHLALADASKRVYMKKLVQNLKEKKAFSLEYLDQANPVDTDETDRTLPVIPEI